MNHRRRNRWQTQVGIAAAAIILIAPFSPDLQKLLLAAGGSCLMLAFILSFTGRPADRLFALGACILVGFGISVVLAGATAIAVLILVVFVLLALAFSGILPRRART